MKKRLIIREIDMCLMCPYLDNRNSYQSKYYCEYNSDKHISKKEVDDMYDEKYRFPKWCPLPEVTDNPEE